MFFFWHIDLLVNVSLTFEKFLKYFYNITLLTNLISTCFLVIYLLYYKQQEHLLILEFVKNFNYSRF